MSDCLNPSKFIFATDFLFLWDNAAALVFISFVYKYKKVAADHIGRL